jgi:hypothetical protein
MRLTILIVFFFVLVDFATAKSFFPKSFEAKLEQQNITITKIGKKNKKTIRNVIKSDVEMKYMFPSNIVFDTKDMLLYVCNSEKTWIYTPGSFGEKGELTVGDSSKYCYSKIFDALANGLKNNSLYTVSSKGKKSILTFTEKAQDRLEILKIDLLFKKKITSEVGIQDLYSMDLYRKDQKRPTKFIFKSLNPKSKFTKKDFIFIPPKHTNIKKI